MKTVYANDPWAGHNGHTFRGVASREGYNDDTAYIYNFHWLTGIPYERDFHLVAGER